MDKTPVEESLGRYQAYVVGGLAFIVVFAVSMVGVMLWQAYSLGKNTERIRTIALTTHDSLCAFRNDLAARQRDTQAYLDAHPRGIVIEGTGEVIISAAELQRNIDSRQEALDALDKGGLRC